MYWKEITGREYPSPDHFAQIQENDSNGPDGIPKWWLGLDRSTTSLLITGIRTVLPTFGHEFEWSIGDNNLIRTRILDIRLSLLRLFPWEELKHDFVVSEKPEKVLKRSRSSRGLNLAGLSWLYGNLEAVGNLWLLGPCTLIIAVANCAILACITHRALVFVPLDISFPGSLEPNSWSFSLVAGLWYDW